MTRTLARLVPALASRFARVRAARAQSLEPPPGYPATPPAAPAGAPVTNPAISQSEEAKDSGLGLEWVYLNGDVGGGYASMDSFSSTTLGLQKTSSAGPPSASRAGVRLIFFSLGVRVRDLQLSGIGDLWELNGEGAFHVRVGHIDAYFGVRGGYNFVGSLNSSTAAVATGDTPSSVSVHGFNVGPMLGLDVYLAKWMSDRRRRGRAVPVPAAPEADHPGARGLDAQRRRARRTRSAPSSTTSPGAARASGSCRRRTWASTSDTGARGFVTVSDEHDVSCTSPSPWTFTCRITEGPRLHWGPCSRRCAGWCRRPSPPCSSPSWSTGPTSAASRRGSSCSRSSSGRWPRSCRCCVVGKAARR